MTLLKDDTFQFGFWKENGFSRQKCKKCGKHFWSLKERDNCGDPPCSEYTFIGHPAFKKTDLKTIHNEYLYWFQHQHGHTPIGRYPVVCRWKPDTFYVGASIYCFMPWVLNGTIEPPANPLVMDQPSVRFADLDNVGLGTGRHCTSFSMAAHHAFNYPEHQVYWKDVTTELCWKWFNGNLKIKGEEIVFKENWWEGGGNAGPCLEVLVGGNEIATLVFMEFEGGNGKYKPMGMRVVDTGYGLERAVWLSQGTPTVYDAIYPEVIDFVRKDAGIGHPDKKVFAEFCKVCGMLKTDEVNVDVTRQRIVSKLSKKLGISEGAMMKDIMPYHDLYQAVDHAKAIMFITGDNVVPSNVQEGYLARLLIRRGIRALSSVGAQMPFSELVLKHIKEQKSTYPEFWENRDNILKMIDVEQKKYAETLKRGRAIVEKIASKGRIDERELEVLYDSHGLLPKDVKNFVGDKVKIADVSDIDTKIAVKKSAVKLPDEKKMIDVSGLPPTEKLYYDEWKKQAFKARVLRIHDHKYVILDKTLFYPRSGGQEPDHGLLNGCRVYDVEKSGNVIIHEVEHPSFHEGDIIDGMIDIERRMQLARHHTATHLVAGAARAILGSHIWQAGSKKDVDVAHIDLTHYELIDEKTVEKIEDLANKFVAKKMRVEKKVMRRDDAEKAYGFRLYQGGAVPGRDLRIINIEGVDVEACGGIHVDNTEEVGEILIMKAERIQDGVVRLVYASGPAAQKQIEASALTLDKCAKLLGCKEKEVPKALEKLFAEWKDTKKKFEKLQKESASREAEEARFDIIGSTRVLIKEVRGSPTQLQEMSRQLSADDTLIILFGSDGHVLASAGKDVKHDCGHMVRHICEKMGGRGGGRTNLAQGNGKPVMIKAGIEEARRLIK